MQHAECQSKCCFLADVGMYIPSKLFQTSQPSVNLLGSIHKHEPDVKVTMTCFCTGVCRGASS